MQSLGSIFIAWTRILLSTALKVNRLPLQSGALADKCPVRWYIVILYRLLRLAGRLPLRWLHRIGAAFGWLVWRIHATPRARAQASLSLAITLISAETRQTLLRRSLIESGKALLEVAKIWNGDVSGTLGLVRDVRGGQLFEQALADGRGLIIAAPHLGCWELLNFWLCSRTPLAIVYRPPRQAALEPLLLKARGALPVEQVRAEGAGVRKLYKRLSSGGVVGILPDQQPKQGEGEFAPFFGTPALTMVLLSRLARRTGATVLFAFAQRLPRGTGYCIHFLPAPDGIAAEELPTAVAALNQGVENCVRIAPEQYQWAYKRYSIRPPGHTQKVY
jgi:KDO2-lipid IV(A) lauroyltransferase